MIVNVMGAKQTTIDSMIKNFIKDNRVEAKWRVGDRTHKLTKDQKLAMRSWVDDDCTILLWKLSSKCLVMFGIMMLETKICRILTAFSYTIKRVHLQPVWSNNAAAIVVR